MRVLSAARSAAAVAVAVVAAYYLACTATSLGATRRPSHPTISVVASMGVTPLYPGNSVHVRATLTNDTAHPFDLAAGTIEGTVARLPTGCLASWFRFAVGAGSPVPVLGNGGTVTVRGKLTLVDVNTDQSACEGARPALTVSVRRRAMSQPPRRTT
jgi:hypothetical protein